MKQKLKRKKTKTKTNLKVSKKSSWKSHCCAPASPTHQSVPVGPPDALTEHRGLTHTNIRHRSTDYSANDTAAEYCDERVCLSVSLSVRDHIFRTTRPIFKIFVRVTCGRGSVLLWRRSDTLCTSGFMDDVISAHKPRLFDVADQLKRSAHRALGLAINCAQ